MLSARKTASGNPWVLLALEALIVMSSVFVALALNSWKEGRDQDEIARQALQRVVDETSINCVRIAQNQPYHRAVANMSRPPEGIRISLLRNDAWDSAKSNGATAYIDYDIAALVGTIYAFQSDHRAIVQSYMQAIYVTAGQLGGAGELKQIHGALDVAAIREMVRVQEQLMKMYGKLRSDIDKRYGKEVDTRGFCDDRTTSAG